MSDPVREPLSRPPTSRRILKKTAGKPVFVVGETPGFAEQGGIINFFLEGDRIRFEINADAARHANSAWMPSC